MKADPPAAAHVAPLNTLVDRWRHDPILPGATTIPSFDPQDAGVAAQVLLLLERPAPSTAAQGRSAVCSEDNPDRTNQLLKQLRRAAGLERRVVVKWNAVPWAAPGSRPDRAAERAAAAAAYAAVVALLPHLRVVITFGTVARDLHLTSLTSGMWASLPVTLAVPHPSPRNARQAAAARQQIAYAFAAARDITFPALA